MHEATAVVMTTEPFKRAFQKQDDVHATPVKNMSLAQGEKQDCKVKQRVKLTMN